MRQWTWFIHGSRVGNCISLCVSTKTRLLRIIDSRFETEAMQLYTCQQAVTNGSYSLSNSDNTVSSQMCYVLTE
jgi:hypothetical protein